MDTDAPAGGDFTTSPTIGKLAAALAKARSGMGTLAKTADNPFFKSKYADLPALVDVIAPMFAEGLMVIQSPGRWDATAKTIAVHTRIAHSSGEWIHGAFTMPAPKAGPQDVGSAITYARRYALQAMLCLAADDDDGEQATGRQAVLGPKGRSTPKAAADDDPEPGWMRTTSARAAMQDAPPDDTEEKQLATYRAYEKQLLECPSLEHLAASWKAATTAKNAGLLSIDQHRLLGKVKDVAKEGFAAEAALGREPGQEG